MLYLPFIQFYIITLTHTHTSMDCRKFGCFLRIYRFIENKMRNFHCLEVKHIGGRPWEKFIYPLNSFSLFGKWLNIYTHIHISEKNQYNLFSFNCYSVEHSEIGYSKQKINFIIFIIRWMMWIRENRLEI